MDTTWTWFETGLAMYWAALAIWTVWLVFRILRKRNHSNHRFEFQGVVMGSVEQRRLTTYALGVMSQGADAFAATFESNHPDAIDITYFGSIAEVVDKTRDLRVQTYERLNESGWLNDNRWEWKITVRGDLKDGKVLPDSKQMILQLEGSLARDPAKIDPTRPNVTGADALAILQGAPL